MPYAIPSMSSLVVDCPIWRRALKTDFAARQAKHGDVGDPVVPAVQYVLVPVLRSPSSGKTNQIWCRGGVVLATGNAITHDKDNRFAST